ncbi:Gfo/Idh/MocA family oxidoreductase [Halomonas nitroreducens]|nr:Gfo/Idh/MocA family oxidoreductase [Halomonas nitroreducens]
MGIRIGMLGCSPGNGHPFSYSAIINGYCYAGLRESGWPVIHDYITCRDPADFGVADLRVTHAWTQAEEVTQALCRTADIQHALRHPQDMLGEVDAVIIARDDVESHRSLADPFLEAGMPVLIDKPLTLDRRDLDHFTPYLEAGQLMSCSAMRYATELDVPRSRLAEYGELKLVCGTILNDWEKYGIHMLEASLSLVASRPQSVQPLPGIHQGVAILLQDGSRITVDALGSVPPHFELALYGSERITRHAITDNFGMFRRMLWAFAHQVRGGIPIIDPVNTLDILRTLIAGQEALDSRREVLIHE